MSQTLMVLPLFRSTYEWVWSAAPPSTSGRRNPRRCNSACYPTRTTDRPESHVYRFRLTVALSAERSRTGQGRAVCSDIRPVQCCISVIDIPTAQGERVSYCRTAAFRRARDGHLVFGSRSGKAHHPVRHRDPVGIRGPGEIGCQTCR